MLSAAAMKSAAAVASFLLGGASALAPSILSVGETLYDSLPKGVFLGGAPLNVAVHAAQLGAHSIYASAVGDDVLGADARRRLEEAGVDTTLIQTAAGSDTGFVTCVVDGSGDASYTIASPSAWDELQASNTLLSVASAASCCVHGSLALRGETTAATLRQLAAGWQRDASISLQLD